MTVLPTFHSLASLPSLPEIIIAREQPGRGSFGKCYYTLTFAVTFPHAEDAWSIWFTTIPTPTVPHGKFLRQPYRWDWWALWGRNLQETLTSCWGNFSGIRGSQGWLFLTWGFFSVPFPSLTEHRAEVMTSWHSNDSQWYTVLFICRGECGCEGQGHF